MLKVWKIKNQKGFTLVETLVGLGVVLIIVLTGYQLLQSGHQTSGRAQIYVAANAVAFGKIQEYENMDFGNLPTGLPGNNYEVEDFTADVDAESEGRVDATSATVHIENDSPSLKKVWVDLEFDYFGKTQDIVFITYIQLGGAGR